MHSVLFGYMSNISSGMRARQDGEREGSTSKGQACKTGMLKCENDRTAGMPDREGTQIERRRLKNGRTKSENDKRSGIKDRQDSQRDGDSVRMSGMSNIKDKESGRVKKCQAWQTDSTAGRYRK